MTVHLRYTNITVSDVEASIPFYRDGLGLELRKNVEYGGGRWLTLGSPDQPIVEIVLSGTHDGRSEADGDAMQELLTKGMLPNIIFRVDNLSSTFDRVVAAGGEVVQEPMDQDWGPRDCAFRDPSGNLIRVEEG
ncbi:MAG: VOC family protein [Microbacteriaceae bacterium]